MGKSKFKLFSFGRKSTAKASAAPGIAHPRPKLVSFADGKFAARRPVFQKKAEASGFFSTVNVHSIESLPADFRAAHGDYMARTARGLGYWIWKPVVILDALNNAAPGETVVYLDGGFSLNPSAAIRFQEYVEIAQSHDSGMLSFMNVLTENMWTKADLFDELGVPLDSPDAKISQFGSGLLVLVNTKSIRDMVQQWCDLAVKDNYRFSDDSPSIAPNHPNFQEHRHDQSIASLLRKAHGTAVTHYEVQSYEDKFDAFQDMLPAWATRSRK